MSDLFCKCFSDTEHKSARLLEIVANPAGISKVLLDGLPMLKQPYKPYPFIRNRHQETIFASFFRSLPDVIFRRECLRMQDNGTVALDWPVRGADCEVGPDHFTRDGCPVLILLPGLTGGSGDSYVRHLLVRARRRGWIVVVFNSRGCANSPVTSPQFYSASFTEDLRQVVRHVGGLFPASHLYAAGWSLGGNILVRYLGQEGENCPLTGAVSLCNPFNLVTADEDFHKGFNNVYDSALARSLRKIFKNHAPLFECIGGEYNIPKAAAARSVRDFDDGLTRVSFGYKSVDDYYKDASSSRSIKDVRIPLLCIQADDDPIAPSRGIPRAEIWDNGNCFLVVTPSGGHLGWVAGEGAPRGAPWTDPLVMDYFELLENSGQVVSSK
ncbi:hypothetical protein L7F22_022123 [Adiantum nelumboides]|nr:hypothetical protein [Adiantum nelumboides]